jgi:hypothetical protein
MNLNERCIRIVEEEICYIGKTDVIKKEKKKTKRKKKKEKD